MFLEISQKFTGKHQFQCLFLDFIKKETMEKVFSCEFREIYKNTFFYRSPPKDCFWQVSLQGSNIDLRPLPVDHDPGKHPAQLTENKKVIWLKLDFNNRN